jgi:hypothetical protein
MLFGGGYEEAPPEEKTLCIIASLQRDHVTLQESQGPSEEVYPLPPRGGIHRDYDCQRLELSEIGLW